MTKLISMDTSSSCTGWSKFLNGKYSDSGTIDCKKEKNGDQRLRMMCSSILSFLDEERPKIVCVETTVVMRNAEAQRMLTMILGVIYGWCITHDCDYVGLRPTEWRKLVKENPTEKIGRKREELKRWSVEKVKELFNVEASDDESDAVLIGQALINRYTAKEVVKQ